MNFLILTPLLSFAGVTDQKASKGVQQADQCRSSLRNLYEWRKNLQQIREGQRNSPIQRQIERAKQKEIVSKVLTQIFRSYFSFLKK